VVCVSLCCYDFIPHSVVCVVCVRGMYVCCVVNIGIDVGIVVIVVGGIYCCHYACISLNLLPSYCI
jgi:hypothetical protein